MIKDYLIILLLCLLPSGAAWGQQVPAVPAGEEEEPLEITIPEVGPETLGRYVVLNRMADFTMNVIYDYDGHNCLCRFDAPPYLPTILCWSYDIYGVVEYDYDNFYDMYYYYVHVSGIQIHHEKSGVVDVSRFSSVYALPDCSMWDYFTLNCRFTKPITVISHYGDYLYAMDYEGHVGRLRGVEGQFAEGDRIKGGELFPGLRSGLNLYEICANYDSHFDLVGHGDPVTPTWTTIGEATADKVYAYLGFKEVNINQDTSSGQAFLCDPTGANIEMVDLFHTGLAPEDVASPNDTNDDGELSIADVNKLLNIILMGSVEQQWITPEDDNGTCDVMAILDFRGTELVLYPTHIVRHGSRSVLRGDVNGDGEVNLADVNTLIDLMLMY